MISSRFAKQNKEAPAVTKSVDTGLTSVFEEPSKQAVIRKDPYSNVSPLVTRNEEVYEAEFTEVNFASEEASNASDETIAQDQAEETDGNLDNQATTSETVESEYGELPIAFQGELMLHRWSESSGTPRTVTFRLSDDEPEHPFRQMRSTMGKISGQRFMAVLVMLDDDEKPVKEVAVKPYGNYARELHRAGWFYDRRVLTVIGSEQEFKTWLVGQSCVVCNTPGPSSVLLSKGFSGVPCCNMHQHMEPSVLASHQPKVIRSWAIMKAVELFGVDSLGYVKPVTFIKKMKELGIAHTIPAGYMAMFENDNQGLSYS